MRCALLLERVDDVVSQVHNSFAEAIKEQTKGVLHQHVLLSLDQAVTAEQERSLESAKYKDVCAQLHEEYFDACLAHSFVALLRVLQAHHDMLRWLSSSHEEAAAAATAAAAAATAAIHDSAEATGGAAAADADSNTAAAEAAAAAKAETAAAKALAQAMAAAGGSNAHATLGGGSAAQTAAGQHTRRRGKVLGWAFSPASASSRRF